MRNWLGASKKFRSFGIFSGMCRGYSSGWVCGGLLGLEEMLLYFLSFNILPGNVG